MTYYEVLGVDTGASTAEIRRAFVRLARMHHPDRNASASAEDLRSSERRMQLINEAWGVLGDERRRADYDRERRAGVSPAARPRRAPGTANPDFVPYDGDEDDFDPELLDDTPYSSTPVPRWLQLMAPTLLVFAVACGSVALVTSFAPFFGLAVVALIARSSRSSSLRCWSSCAAPAATDGGAGRRFRGMASNKTACFVKMVAHPGKRDDLVGALREMFPTVGGEDGTLIYSVHVDKADDTAVWIYELYESDDALATHGGSDAMKSLLGALAGLVAEAPMLVFTTPTDAKGFDL